MNQNRSWLIPALAGAFVLLAAYQKLGGLEGIQRDPTMSLSVVGIMTLIFAPILWLSYRRQKRAPMLVELEKPAPNSDDGANTMIASQVIVASRWKAAVKCLLLIPVMVVIVLLGLAQHSLCQIAIMAVLASLLLGGVIVTAASVLFPGRLVIAAEGLTHKQAWRTRRWSWNEVRHVTCVHTSMPFTQIRLSAGVMFQRYAPADSARGAWRQVFRSSWPMGDDKLADRLNQARARWSTNEGASFVPVPKSPLYYVRTAIIYVAIGLMLWVLIASPCSPS